MIKKMRPVILRKKNGLDDMYGFFSKLSIEFESSVDLDDMPPQI
jgi:hypothetical protein